MDIVEALALARSASIPAVIAHHFDLFAFNTVPRSAIETAANDENQLLVKAAQLGIAYHLT